MFAEGQENQWYIDIGWSKHIIGDKYKLISYNDLEKEKNVTFGNDSHLDIKGKGYVFLKEKVKVGNVMYVDGLKNNMLSVSKMCDQGNEVVFWSKECVVHELDTRNAIIKGTRTLSNLYILKGGQEKCYLGKAEENWLWHKRLGHLSFSQISKWSRLKVVHDLPIITIPESTICKSRQFGKKTRAQFNAKEWLASKPLELIQLICVDQ